MNTLTAYTSHANTATATTDTDDLLGRQLAQMLSQAVAEQAWPHARAERLRAARAQALAHRKRAVPRKQTALQQALAMGDAQQAGLGGWGWLGSALPLLALLVGLVALQAIDREHNVADMASIDSALLIDDLPPAAYADIGFMQFLRQPVAASATQE